MRWQRTLIRYGIQAEQEGVQTDPFSLLAKLPGDSRATVSSTAKRALSYGEIAVSTTVTVHCPHTEAAISLAGELSFKLALELTNDAMQLVAPQLPRIDEEIT